MTCWSDGRSLRWRRLEGLRGCRGWCRGAASAARCSAGSAAGEAGEEARRPPGDPQAIGGGREGKKDENISFWEVSGQVLCRNRYEHNFNAIPKLSHNNRRLLVADKMRCVLLLLLLCCPGVQPKMCNYMKGQKGYILYSWE